MAHGVPPLRTGHQLDLLRGSLELFPALVAAVDGARHEVRLETYIFDFTGTGADVADALARAAQRGVGVMVVIDGFGSGPVPQAWRERWDQAGLQWRIYAPPGRLGVLWPGNWGRLHRKLALIDGEIAFCGGINILDDLHDPSYGRLEYPRFDFAVRVTGPLTTPMRLTLVRLWQRLHALERPQRVRLVGAIESLRAYRRAISRARSEIIIANAYFVPGRKMRHALVRAARRGVKVQLLLQGRYEYFMQYYASRPVYASLLAAGVEIYEYSPSFLHAKVAVIDGEWSTVGSSNLDPFSLLLAREANLLVQDRAFSRGLRTCLLQAMASAGRRLDPEAFARRPLRQRVSEWLAYGLMRVALATQGKKYL
jgi:cardiolipin synthase